MTDKLRIISGFVFCAFLTACGGGTGTPPPVSVALPTPLPVGIVQQSGAVYLGAQVNPSGVPGASNQAVVSAFEAKIGRKLALDMHYYRWNDAFPGRNEADDAENGRIPVISWNCGASDGQVASGAQDAAIRTHADAIKAYGSTIFLRYKWEMNLTSTANGRAACYDPKHDDPNGFFSASEYVAAWLHIRQIFAQEDVGNVVWLWNPSAGGQDALSYYPGAQAVDWVGLDEYDLNGAAFAQTFQNGYAELASLNKPILIAETGATQNDQSAFFAQAASTLKHTYPLVAGFMYFDAVGPRADWRLSPDGLSAFGAMAKDPYFAARGKP
jgi:hypothetical protein